MNKKLAIGLLVSGISFLIFSFLYAAEPLKPSISPKVNTGINPKIKEALKNAGTYKSDFRVEEIYSDSGECPMLLNLTLNPDGTPDEDAPCITVPGIYVKWANDNGGKPLEAGASLKVTAYMPGKTAAPQIFTLPLPLRPGGMATVTTQPLCIKAHPGTTGNSGIKAEIIYDKKTNGAVGAVRTVIDTNHSNNTLIVTSCPKRKPVQ